MRKLFWLGVLAAAFYAHSRFVFSEPAVMRWMQQQQQLAMQGADGMCDAYASDLAFEIKADTGECDMQLQGGKDEMCEQLKDASATFRAMQASVDNNVELVNLQPAGFPWLAAQVTVRQSTTVRMRGAPSITEVANVTLTLRRTLKGREISRLNSTSTATFGQ